MTVKIMHAHVLDGLALIEDESVNCVVTSPPYYGLRDYELAPQIWGGDPECRHAWGEGLRLHKGGPHGDGVLADGGRGVIAAQAAVKDIDAGAFCRDCGAWRGELGLEPSPELYIDHLLMVFAEVHRVLRRDGTLWLNIADSYCSRGGASGALAATGLNSPPRAHMRRPEQVTPELARWRRQYRGAKNKDLLLIPSLLALELRAAGWYVRKDNVVHKRNPMPESVEDRTTSAHEYVFHLTKSESYWYDAAAIREPFADERMGRDYRPQKVPAGWADYDGAHGAFHKNGRARPERQRNRGGRTDGYTKRNGVDSSANGGRNRRSVWTISTHAFPEAHFATMAPEVAEICILAGCPVAGVVLDPFLGSGTTAMVADRLARNVIGIELSASYVDMAHRRAREPGFALVPPVAEAAE